MAIVIRALLLSSTLVAALFADAATAQPKTATNAASRPAISQDELMRLSDAALMAVYASPNDFEPMAGFHVRPFREEGPAQYPTYTMFREVRREIVRRGGRMDARLAAFVRSERRSERAAPTSIRSGLDNPYARDVTELLAKIRTRQSAELLLETLADGAANARWRREAVYALEHATYLAYHRYESSHPNYANTVPRDGAEPAPLGHPTALEPIAGFYRAWLDGEGRDAGAWLPLAQRRARAMLAGDEMVAAVAAVAFLHGGDILWNERVMGRDDQPEQTAARIAQILEGQRVGGFATRLAAYGPIARPYVGTLIRIHRDHGPGAHYHGLRDLTRVGGIEVTRYLVERLPVIERELTQRNLTDPKFFGPSLVIADVPQDQALSDWIFAARVARYGFDRWAGRTFATTDERLKWWATNGTREPEKYLRENLSRAVAEADAGDGFAGFIVQAALPNLRAADLWRDYDPTTMWGDHYPPATQPAPFRVKWFEENEHRLRYDAIEHCLRLADPYGR